MSNVLMMIIVTSTLVLSLMYIAPGPVQSLLLLQQQKYAYAQAIPQDNNNTTSTANLLSALHPDVDSSPIAAVIIIGKDMQGNVTYVPNNVTIKLGQEILVVNNDTNIQSVTNGMSPDDPLAGKLFDTGPIPPRGFAEYVASNLSPGTYSFYSTNTTSTKGVLTIEPNI